MPRRNTTIRQSHRARRRDLPEPQWRSAETYEQMASDLVRRGLASIAILDRTSHQPASLTDKDTNA